MKLVVRLPGNFDAWRLRICDHVRELARELGMMREDNLLAVRQSGSRWPRIRATSWRSIST